MYKYYKYLKQKNDTLFLIKYLVGAVCITVNKDEYGNKYLYGKYIYINPLFILVTLLQFIFYLCLSFYIYIKQIFSYNKDNNGKGFLLGIIK